MALNQPDNCFIHLKEREITLLYIEIKPPQTKEDVELYKKIIDGFLERHLKILEKTKEASR